MKQIPILSGRCLVVELPEGAETVHVAYNNGFWYLIYFTHNGEILTRKRLPKGNWRIIGMLSEVTEEEAGELVGWVEKAPGLKCFVDYKKGRPTHSLFTSIESLESAILAEGFSFENTEYVKPDHSLNADYDRWLEAQSRVLDRSRCLLLGREDEN